MTEASISPEADATIISPETVGDVHTSLPEDFRRPMSAIIRRGGPWSCSVCGGPSYVCYRCSKCGNDLA